MNLAVPALADPAIDVFLPGDTAASASPLTMHSGARQTNYLSMTGNHSGMTDLPGTTTTPSWFFLARVEVVARDSAAAVVTFGDSITDGSHLDARHQQPLARSPGEAADGRRRSAGSPTQARPVC